MSIMNKKATHLGMMLSFVVFIFFLIFVFLILTPQFKQNKDQTPLLNQIKNQIVENATKNLTTITIINRSDQAPSISCIEIQSNLLWNWLQPWAHVNITVKNPSGSVVKSWYLGNKMKIDWTGNEEVFNLYITDASQEEVFNSYLHSGVCPTRSEDVDLGLFKTEKYLFQYEVNKLLNQQNLNPEELKTRFKVPEGREFNFAFKNKEGVITGPDAPEINVDIYSEEFDVTYVDEDANINQGWLIIRVW